jgi:hypothetical protein
MYGMTRGMVTLLGAGAAGLLVWFATQVNDTTTGGYWAAYGLIAGAGLVMALSQLLGGWTKGRMPRLAINVFLVAFIPTLIAAGWVIVAHQPDPNWFRDHITSWSSDIGILNVVRDLVEYVSVLAFGVGLVFGFSLDTAPPAERTGRLGRRRRAAAVPVGAGAARRSATEEDDASAPTAREEAATRENGSSGPRIPFRRRRDREPVERS